MILLNNKVGIKFYQDLRYFYVTVMIMNCILLYSNIQIASSSSIFRIFKHKQNKNIINKQRKSFILENAYHNRLGYFALNRGGQQQEEYSVDGETDIDIDKEDEYNEEVIDLDTTETSISDDLLKSFQSDIQKIREEMDNDVLLEYESLRKDMEYYFLQQKLIQEKQELLRQEKEEEELRMLEEMARGVGDNASVVEDLVEEGSEVVINEDVDDIETDDLELKQNNTTIVEQDDIEIIDELLSSNVTSSLANETVIATETNVTAELKPMTSVNKTSSVKKRKIKKRINDVSSTIQDEAVDIVESTSAEPASSGKKTSKKTSKKAKKQAKKSKHDENTSQRSNGNIPKQKKRKVTKPNDKISQDAVEQELQINNDDTIQKKGKTMLSLMFSISMYVIVSFLIEIIVSKFFSTTPK